MTSIVRPLLTVVIPVRNGERYLAASIDSVLQNAVDHVEIIVVDDGSTDRSAEIAQSFGPQVHCLRREPRGIAAARNAGWSAATGEFVLHLDADDLVVAGSIAVRMAEFAGDPDVDMVTGYTESFFSPDIDPEIRSRIVLDRPRRGHLAGSSIVRSSLFARIGPLNEAWRVGADVEDARGQKRESGLWFCASGITSARHGRTRAFEDWVRCRYDRKGGVTAVVLRIEPPA